MKQTFIALLATLVVSGCSFFNDTLPQEIELNEEWTFRQVGKTEWHRATVPGTVHTDLMAAGIIEDPFYRNNELDVQWVDKEDWEYKTTFSLTRSQLSQSNLTLVFKGLDTYADVYVNDSLLLSADNMFRTWEVDVKPVAKKGTNELRILFHSPIKKGLELLNASPWPLPNDNDQSQRGGLGDQKVSVFTRKAPYHYGWDWGPRLVTSGIWRPVVIRTWDEVRINDLFIKQPVVTKERAELVASVDIETNEVTDGSITIVNVADGLVFARKNIVLQPGKNKIDINFSIEKPKLWWSNGLGEPNMYSFKAVLHSKDRLVDEKVVRTGIRSVRLVRIPDAKGESFQFELNGVPVFAKGANYIPNDNFLPRVTREKYEKVVDNAFQANMNMLRIWGGGVYEDDYFYELCDRKGIMVWQDFMFACAMFPGDKAFQENVRQEAIDNVVRLRNHPSIVLWCGNNEVDAAWKADLPNSGWGWKQKYTAQAQNEIFEAYLKIFHEILPEVVAEYTDGKDYWPSSPMSGPEPNQHSFDDSTAGDIHYWGVWHGLHPFEAFDKYVGRFMSEYGFQSFPDFETVKTYTKPDDWNIESEVMAAHQRSGIGNLRIKEYMGWDYKVPHDFEKFLYLSQVLQARGIQMGIEAHRRAMPYCMGTLYWQLNDCWPVASWSGTDYYQKWKALHYAVKEAYQPVVLSFKQEKEVLQLYVVSDELKAQKGTLKMKLIDFEGNVLLTDEGEIEIPGNLSTLQKSYFLNALLTKGDKANSFVHAALIVGNKVVAENTFFFVKPKDQKLPDVSPRISVTEKEGKISIEIGSDQLVRNVYLSVPGKEVFFSDNYFDLLPGQPVLVTVTSTESIATILDQIKVMHLREAMN